MFNSIFPLKLHLNILQLEEYKPIRFIKWNLKNLFRRKVQTKKGLVYTSKIKKIIFIYFLICLISLLLNIFIFILLIIEPFIGLTIAILILKPYEIWNKNNIIGNSRKKIRSFKNLKVIGITGSFGKSSTKEILYQLIKNKFRTLRTPESFNTVLGIAKVIDLELDKSYEFFICEMAAYTTGEIKELCYMSPPDFGILTGITTQHFERFGSLENTINAKFELVDAIKNKNNIILNLEDENISHEISKRNIIKPKGILKAKKVSFNEKGSNFEIDINGKNYKLSTPLFGFANVKNILAASSMALKLGLSVNDVVLKIKTLTPVDNRLVLTTTGGSIIVNNTYSSNPQGFKETIKTAKFVKGTKVLVTPGLVELGNLETEIHTELGQLSNEVFDKVILVGKNNRTKNLANGLGKHEFIEDNRKEYFKKIEELKGKYDWIFLENDVTENY